VENVFDFSGAERLTMAVVRYGARRWKSEQTPMPEVLTPPRPEKTCFIGRNELKSQAAVHKDCAACLPVPVTKTARFSAPGSRCRTERSASVTIRARLTSTTLMTLMPIAKHTHFHISRTRCWLAAHHHALHTCRSTHANNAIPDPQFVHYRRKKVPTLYTCL